MPKEMHITVVIPCFNAAGTLGSLLEGLHAQTLPRSRWDVVVVDDGSTDNTRAEALRFKDVRVLEQGSGGVGAARNAGARAATGDIVLFLDADLEAAPDLLERHLECHERYPDVAAVGGAVAPLFPLRMFTWLMADHLSSWFNAHPAAAMPPRPEYLPSLNFSVKRRRVFTDSGVYWPEGLPHTGEDVLFCLELRRHDLPLTFCPAALVRHRDRTTCRGYRDHMYRWGFHAPLVRGRNRGLRFGFLFSHSLTVTWMLAPVIVCGYTGLIWRAWLRACPVRVTLALPQLLVGRIAYMAGVLDGVRVLRGRSYPAAAREAEVPRNQRGSNGN